MHRVLSFFLNPMIKFIIFQSPVRCNEQFLRRLGRRNAPAPSPAADARYSLSRGRYIRPTEQMKSSGCCRYSKPCRCLISCSWCIFRVVSGRRDNTPACATILSCVSPGSPGMTCPPVRIPREAVLSTASAAAWKVCPRLMRQSVLSSVLSMPYSTKKECMPVHLLQIVQQAVGHTVGRVPMTRPTTPSADKASSYFRFRSSSSPYVLV